MNKTTLNLGLGLILLMLVGCEAAEDSAQRLVEETKKEARSLLDEAVGDTVEQFNQQVDALQASADQALGREEKATEQERDEPETEQDSRSE